MSLPVLFLKKREERRLRAGHVWVFSNEVDTQRSPIKSFEPGSLAVIQASSGKPMGVGYVNPHSLICARLLTRKASEVPNKEWLQERIELALNWRNQVYDTPYYRLTFGESEGVLCACDLVRLVMREKEGSWRWAG